MFLNYKDFSRHLLSATVLHWPVEFNFFCVFPKCVYLSLLQSLLNQLWMLFHLLLLAWCWSELIQGLYPIVFQQLPSLFLCCHSRLLSFRITLLVLIAVFLTAVVFLPSKGIIYQSPQLFYFLIPPHWYLLFYHTEIHHLAPPATWLSMSLSPLSIPTSVPSTLTTGPSIFLAGHCLSYFTLHWLHTSLAPAICGRA